MSVKSLNTIEISDTFSAEEIILQSKRILAHPTFTNSPTLTKFLEFIISEVVHKREQQIKEYSIAINVLKRPRDFNSHEDAVVRIHAGRLRRALSEYYYTLGINDLLIIQIPKGSYMPHFQRNGEKKGITALPPHATNIPPNDQPVVAIFPFRMIPDNQSLDAFSQDLGEQLSTEFSRFRQINLIGYYSAEMRQEIEKNILDAGKSIGADFILTGSIRQRNQNVRVRVYFLNTKTGTILSSACLEKELTSPLLDIVDQLAREIMHTLNFTEDLPIFTRQ